MAGPTHEQAWAWSEVLRCGYPVLPHHQELVWPAFAPNTGPGAVVIAHGRTALVSVRLQHNVPQTKELGCADALSCKRARLASGLLGSVA